MKHDILPADELPLHEWTALLKWEQQLEADWYNLSPPKRAQAWRRFERFLEEAIQENRLWDRSMEEFGFEEIRPPLPHGLDGMRLRVKDRISTAKAAGHPSVTIPEQKMHAAQGDFYTALEAEVGRLLKGPTRDYGAFHDLCHEIAWDRTMKEGMTWRQIYHFAHEEAGGCPFKNHDSWYRSFKFYGYHKGPNKK